LAPTDVALLEIDVPPELTVERCEPETIISNWMIYPAPCELQDFGSQWLNSLRSAVLQVSAAVMPVESNFLLNPRHPSFAQVSIVREVPFSFDSRLLGSNE
jgi:RES domain-containing protein